MEEFKHEYQTADFNYNIQRAIAYNHNSLFEEYHSIKAIHTAAVEITKEIITRYKTLTTFQRLNGTYFNTGWFVRPRSVFPFDIESMFLTKTHTPYPIIFCFAKMKDETELQTLERIINSNNDAPDDESPELKQVRNSAFSNESARILISFNLMDRIINIKNGTLLLQSFIAHELRHVVDQFILENINTIHSAKKSLNSDYKKNNIFNINIKENRILNDMFYFLSEEEQSARIQAVYELCHTITSDANYLERQLDSSLENIRIFRYSENISYFDENYRMYVIAALRITPFSHLHQLYNFKITKDKICAHIDEYHKELLVLGYYLCKHKYIKSPELKKFFTIENTTKKFSEDYNESDYDMYIALCLYINRNYLRYQNIIYNTVGKFIKQIYRPRKPGDFKPIVSNQENEIKLTLLKEQQILTKARKLRIVAEQEYYMEHKPYLYV